MSDMQRNRIAEALRQRDITNAPPVIPQAAPPLPLPLPTLPVELQGNVEGGYMRGMPMQMPQYDVRGVWRGQF